MGGDSVTDMLQEAARGFLSAHQRAAGSRVAPTASQKLSEPLVPFEPWKLGEPEWVEFRRSCKLSAQTKREMEKLRAKWIKQRTQPAREKLFKYRRYKRENTRRYRQNRGFLPSCKYKRMKYRAACMGVEAMPRGDFERLVGWLDGKQVRVDIRRMDKSRGFTLDNVQLYVNGVLHPH